MVTTPQEQLDQLLSQDPASMRETERREFDRLAGGRPIVLMGAGGLGRRTLSGLRRHGVEPLALADNATARHGTEIEGIRVLSPADAAREFGRRAVFVVTIWGANSPHRLAHSRQQLQDLGCEVITSFPPLFWKYADALLPFYLQDLPSRVLESHADVTGALNVWENEASRAEYITQVRFRLLADFDGLSHPVAHPQYFPDDLFEWSREWVVDGGAFDGDSIRAIWARYGDNFERILALEPDPSNFATLRATVDALPAPARARIDCRHIAVGSRRRTLYMDATGTAASATSAESSETTVAVEAETIDALVEGSRPTFIKLDIEGFETEALEGARRTIDRDAPILAVCVYHRQRDLWEIPLRLKEWRPDYALFLRPHNEEGWDLVCYAVPRARLKAGAS